MGIHGVDEFMGGFCIAVSSHSIFEYECMLIQPRGTVKYKVDAALFAANYLEWLKASSALAMGITCNSRTQCFPSCTSEPLKLHNSAMKSAWNVSKLPEVNTMFVLKNDHYIINPIQ